MIRSTAICAAAALLTALVMTLPISAHADAGHPKSNKTDRMLDHMRRMHEGHKHMHDFEAMQTMPPEKMRRVMNAMLEIGLAVPPMDSHRGRELFVGKGCIVCHRVNGVGGEIGPSLNAADMPAPMNAFEFAARMWRGAGAMIEMQRELFGDQIELSGQDLSDLVAFAHDKAEQSKLSKDDIPPKFRKLIR